MDNPLRTWQLYFNPENKPIGIVTAPSESEAIKKAPDRYRVFPGEVLAMEVIS